MMVKMILVIFVSFVFAISVSAQCNGIYFKESDRQVFSNPFTFSYIEDFDNDGLNDIFGYTPTAPTSYQIYYYDRTSSDSFDTTAKNTTITGVNGNFGVFGDVNNDGKKDLIISHETNPPILTTYLNDGTGRFLTTTPAVNILSGERFITAGDLNNDGKADVLSTTYIMSSNTSKLYYRLAQTDNSFGAAVEIATFSGFLQFATSHIASNAGVIVEDLNNDGFRDITLAIETLMNPERILKVLTNTGNTTFNQTLSTDFNTPYKGLKSIDLNNDGNKDFVSEVDQGSTNPDIYNLKILANTGNNTFSASEVSVPPSYSFINYYVNGYSSGDFDADGLTDIIVPGVKKYLFLKNQGSFTFSQQEFKSYLNINSVEQVDGDSKSDVISLNRPFIDGYLRLTSPNAVYFLYNSVRFRQNVCNPAGQTKTVDFDGDGLTDRAFWNPSTGIWRYYVDKSQNDQVYFQWGSGAFGDVPVPNDYDGDGQTDYAVFRKSDGNWWILRSSDQQIFTVKFGITEDKPVSADYDGDGKADIAVYRPSEGIWYILLSQTNQFQAIRFGLSEDKPLPADFDGDGKADIAVYRPSSGIWYRINSSDASFSAVHYGISTDTPVPADYDGDGKANIAVYRDGNWYVLRNDFSSSVFYWGTTNDTPFFGNDFESAAFIYRRTGSTIYSTNYPSGIYGHDLFSTGNSFDEILVSTILPSL